MTSEFSLIDQFFKPLSSTLSSTNGVIGIGDDGAVVNLPQDRQMVVVTDTLIEGLHFPSETSAEDIAWKALAVNLSDLAAMGAEPAFYSLALTLPASKNSQAWLEAFANGLHDLASRYSMPLIGGDTTRSDQLVITITAHGWIEKQQALLRSGAKEGDLIYVSGEVGDAGLALKQLQQKQTVDAELLQALNRPQPMVALGRSLIGIASAVIDVSDGFLADLNHILSQSNVGAEIDYAMMPFSANMQHYLNSHKDGLFPLTCGDDYQLIFTVSNPLQQQVQTIARDLNIAVCQVGKIVNPQQGLSLINAPEEVDLKKLGKHHLGFLHYS